MADSLLAVTCVELSPGVRHSQTALLAPVLALAGRMSAQLLLLLDLDQCVPLSLLTRGGDNKVDDDGNAEDQHSVRRRLRHQCARLRRACLRLLASKLRPRNDQRHFHHVPKFAYRFYSSSGFFSVESSAPTACRFHELGEDSVQGFVEELWSKLERLVGDGDDQEEGRGKSDRVFDGRDFQRHLQSEAAKSGADTLKRALEDIAVSP